MARTNVKSVSRETTHEGGRAVPGLTPLQQLQRTVLACFLWENNFYEDGVSVADRIYTSAEACKPEDVAGLAVTARAIHNLRHVPLLLLRVLARTGAGKPGLVSGAIENVIRRADELAEFLALYQKDRRQPLSAQVKKGLAKAFQRFDEYALAKYNRDGAYKLRDVLFLCHAKPKSDAQAALWKRLIDGELATPDTWEVGLSKGGDKKETFERLLREDQLGYLALLRNLRNMVEAGCDRELIKGAILARKGANRVLPFRYVAAARAAPSLEPSIDIALQAAIAELPVLQGHTCVLVDVSGSMDDKLSAKSDMRRIDAAAALGAIINAPNLTLATFSNQLAILPPRKGMSGVDAIVKSQPHGGTYLAGALQTLNDLVVRNNDPLERLIVISDEQAHDNIGIMPVVKHKYLINVATHKNGVGYRGGWLHCDGFSEGVLRYIHAMEAEGFA